MATGSVNSLLRLRKHADYGRVYNATRKLHARQMSYFFSLRPPDRRSETPGPRIGLTVGKVLGKAVDRNRIKRRMREAVRHHAHLLTYPVDIILHPRRSVLELDWKTLDREVSTIFRSIEAILGKTETAKRNPEKTQPGETQPRESQTPKAPAAT